MPWTLRALDERGVSDVYVWSDDNLSTDYFFTHLPPAEQHYLATHPRYGRVACFKGFDAESFAFNTTAAPELFDRQFALFARLLATGMDLYGYATFTTPSAGGIAAKMRAFTDRLQRIAEHLPLRVVPLEIQVWGPVAPRMRADRHASLGLQQEAIAAWRDELTRRFTPAELGRTHHPSVAEPAQVPVTGPDRQAQPDTVHADALAVMIAAPRRGAAAWPRCCAACPAPTPVTC